jgi:hypothetical protein
MPECQYARMPNPCQPPRHIGDISPNINTLYNALILDLYLTPRMCRVSNIVYLTGIFDPYQNL